MPHVSSIIGGFEDAYTSGWLHVEPINVLIGPFMSNDHTMMIKAAMQCYTHWRQQGWLCGAAAVLG